MKKIFSISMLVAAAAMAFVSCQKPETALQDTVTVSGLMFSSEKPVFVDETKTEWTGSTINWNKADKIRVAYKSDCIWQNADGTSDDGNDASYFISNQLGADCEAGKFKIPTYFTALPKTNHIFYGVYPSTCSDKFSAPSATIIIPSEQTPLANSFDSNADILLGVSDEVGTVALKQEISMKWTRQVAHGQITLTAISGYTSGEAVQTIKLTANSDAYMVGGYSVPLDSPVFTKDGSNTEPNVLTIKGTNLTAVSRTANVNGTDETVYDVTFWASFLPCTVKTLTVVVETDKATYTRAITLASDKYLNFLQNRRNILSIDMSGATRDAIAGTENNQTVSWAYTKDYFKAKKTGTLTTDAFEWTYERSRQDGTIDNGTYSGVDGNAADYTAGKIGSGTVKENMKFTTSNITGVIKSVAVECASASGLHQIDITVGGTSYLSSSTPSWSNAASLVEKKGSGASSGQIVINFTAPASNGGALYIKSITVVYEPSQN